MVKKSGCGWLY